jgi:phenylpropionate dioxygenase-like ring-hydroxylating dioxygenase large terminal subunit
MAHRPTKAVRILGESLVLFRDALGSFGLIGDRCPHWRASSATRGRDDRARRHQLPLLPIAQACER